MTSLHAGLIPIASRESGVEVRDFGVMVSGATVEEIRRATLELSRRPAEELRLRSRAAWRYARSYHTRDRFAAEFRSVVERLLDRRAMPLRLAA